MPTDIYIYCPSGEEGATRGDLEDDVEAFFGSAARFSGAGSGAMGFNLDFELADSEDVDSWVHRLRQFLQQAGVGPGTVFEVFPADYEDGKPWRQVEVFGRDRWITTRDD